ncbi:MAG: molecular chaperone HtpG [Clostridia bacterium]|nr:molecular chaperone HtpG [Clostridia bacterium]
MAKKQFKTESKRILDLMINSIYTNKDIFLRELISNASDAIDKLAFISLTDDSLGLSRSDFEIRVDIDKENRILTISDNGIGMDRSELESNLGTIAKSGTKQFKDELEKDDDQKLLDVIGQFGVGFYSAFMVSDHVIVISKKYNEEHANQWESFGNDGYTIKEAERDSVGTDVILHIRSNSEEGDEFDKYLEDYTISSLIRKYSDYIRYPIKMMMEHSRKNENKEDGGDEWETYLEEETVNSMVPIWQRNKKDVDQEEYDEFYKNKFFDFEKPIATVTVNAEGLISYKALLFIPGRAPYDYYTREYEKGLQLYSNGVMIMEKCADLIPDYYSFVKGVVDTPDVSLNISREMLQHTRQLTTIRNNIEKRITNELQRIQEEDRETYKKFWDAFATQIKYSIVDNYGANKDKLADLLMFATTHESGFATLKEYTDRMKDDQKYIYYAAGENFDRITKLPQVERIMDKEYEILVLTDEVDEFVIKMLDQFNEHSFKSVDDEDAIETTEDEKEKFEKTVSESEDLMKYIKNKLEGKVSDVRVSKILRSHSVCLTSEGPVSIEMEKYMAKRNSGVPGFSTEKVLEINPDSDVFSALSERFANEEYDLLDKYIELLYGQALLIAELPLEDPSAYSDLICSLMK